jgi:hypothetical protein
MRHEKKNCDGVFWVQYQQKKYFFCHTRALARACTKTMSVKGGVYVHEAYEAKKN